MKRSLKPTDLRDMTLGQLQVIVNDLHSQIESELTTHTHTLMQCRTYILYTHTHIHTKLLTSPFNGRNEQDNKWGITCTCILTLTIFSECESTFIYVSHFKELYQFPVSPEHLLLPHCAHHWSWCSMMNNLSFYKKTAAKFPMSPTRWASFYFQNRLSPSNSLWSENDIFWQSWRNNRWCENHHWCACPTVNTRYAFYGFMRTFY